jgi:regulator of sigma D
MMNEMATLMSKLEQQVAKAANKMSSRAEELKIRLNRQVEELLREGQDLEKHAEVNLTNLSSELRSRLENLAVDVQNNISKESEGARSLLSDLDASGLERLESEQNQLSSAIVDQCEQFKGELEKLTGSVQGRLNSLIASRNDELARLSESILEQLKESHDSYSEKVTQRFERFRERMGEENASITQSLERNMRSMIEEIDSSLERACEKLRSTKLDLEQTISHTVAVCEMAVAQKTKELLAESILPKLNEQKEILRTMIHDMGKQVATESNTAMLSQLAKLEESINLSSEKLKRTVEDCLTELESSGRGLKSGLEETFRRSSQDLVLRTQEVNAYLKDTEKRMLESDLTLKSLAESSTVDAEPELNEERNHALNKLGSLKQQANKDLASAIEHNIDSMEDQSEKLFAELTNKRSELTTTIRDSAELNLDRVRQALAAATAAIQAAREKHME